MDPEEEAARIARMPEAERNAWVKEQTRTAVGVSAAGASHDDFGFQSLLSDPSFSTLARSTGFHVAASIAVRLLAEAQGISVAEAWQQVALGALELP